MRPSPNHDARSASPDMLLLHYTGMKTAEAALSRLTDPAAKVSAHYTIDEDGRLYAHVPEERRAWHAGVSFWEGETDINSRAVGIELVNPGHEFGYRDFPADQIARLISLANAIIARHAIPAHRVLGHSDVAPLRKNDPGERFPWARLAEAGIGLWPEPVDSVNAASIDEASGAAAVAALQARLRRVGYGLDLTGRYDPATRAVVTAFQRHWRPRTVDGVADGETVAILERVAALKAVSRSTG